jgi:hypothetical protein
MEHLRRQNDELRHRGSVLEVAVLGRDDQVRRQVIEPDLNL